jgi:hypothetical protein
MRNLQVSRLRTLLTVALSAGLLTAGLAVAPGASAVETTAGSPDRVNAPYTPCYVDGITYGQGSPVGSAPLKWKYSGTPYAGARYDRCTNTVKFYYGGYRNLDHYAVRWTLSPQGTTHTFNDYAAGSRVATLRARHTSGYYTTYTVQVRAYYGNLHTAWSPIVYLSYYP